MNVNKVAALAAAVRRDGGYVMEAVNRRLRQGYRVRVWMPTVGSGDRVAEVALGFGWEASVKPHYEGLDFHASGVQVVVQFSDPSAERILRAGVAGELGEGRGQLGYGEPHEASDRVGHRPLPGDGGTDTGGGH